MSLALLREWVEGCRAATGRAVFDNGEGEGFCIEAGEGIGLIAVEWDAQAHGVHLYGHPGHAVASPDDAMTEEGGGDDAEDEAFDGPVHAPRRALRMDLRQDEHEQRCLHVAPDTGLATLSLKVPMAALSAVAFGALVEDFIEDIGFWALVFAGDGPGEGGAPGPGHRRALPLGLLRG